MRGACRRTNRRGDSIGRGQREQARAQEGVASGIHGDHVDAVELASLIAHAAQELAVRAVEEHKLNSIPGLGRLRLSP